MKKASIVLPCYNDELSIKPSTERIMNILNVLQFSYEIILIDDASNDNSKSEIKKPLLHASLNQSTALEEGHHVGRQIDNQKDQQGAKCV